jgi:membrane protein
VSTVLRRAVSEILVKFNRDRGTHLAAMIAYFALISFFPLTFLALALLGLAGTPSAQSFLVKELEHAFPGASVANILRVVRTVQDNAAALGAVGAVTLAWSSLSLFSVLESALNIVYDRPNRSFLHGKLRAALIMSTLLVALFTSLLAGSLGYDVLKRYVDWISSPVTAYVVAVFASTAGVFGFLVAAYRLLPNVSVHLREIWVGALAATVVLEVSFQVLPVYLRISNENPAAQVFGGPLILLIWLYVMANVVVLGAELNQWLAVARPRAPVPPAPGASAATSRRFRARRR